MFLDVFGTGLVRIVASNSGTVQCIVVPSGACGFSYVFREWVLLAACG